MNLSEEFIYNLTKKSFLSLWTYPNPIRKKNKELCDILIFSHPHIIIISVKEILPTDSGDFEVDWERWKKTALEKSFKQIYGAERFLESVDYLITPDTSHKFELPDRNERKYHRIAIAIGGEERMPLMWGDMGKGFIHVFDKISSDIIISELDTITDFVKYLTRKEELYENYGYDKIIITGSEEDLLAQYLGNSESFDTKYTKIFLDVGLWDGYINNESNKKWKEDIKGSYAWDNIIEQLIKDYKQNRMLSDINYSEFELVMRTMAKESRENRIILSKEFVDFFNKPNIRSRPVASYSGISYVFLTTKRNEDRKDRKIELIGRCMIVRVLIPESDTVIGIATEKNDGERGFSLDVAYLYRPIISETDKNNIDKMVNELGWFKKSYNKINAKN